MKKTYPISKVKIYFDNRKNCKDAYDAYSLFFPIPKKEQTSEVRGIYKGFSIGQEQVIMCCWGEVLKYQRINQDIYLGKRIEFKKLPKFVQKWVKGMCRDFYQE